MSGLDWTDDDRREFADRMFRYATQYAVGERRQEELEDARHHVTLAEEVLEEQQALTKRAYDEVKQLVDKLAERHVAERRGKP